MFDRHRALSTPLLSNTCIELAARKTNINETYLINEHQMFMDNGRSLDTNELVKILGGSNAILKHYLSSNNLSPLTNQQLHSINQLLTATIDDTKTDTSAHDNDQSLTLIVSTKNTYLHQLLREDIADKLIRITFSKTVVVFMGIITASMFVYSLAVWSCGNFNMISSDYWDIYYISWFLLMSTYTSLWLLSMNRTAVKLILKTFEFWFKMFHAIRYSVCYVIIRMHLNNGILTAWNILTSISVILVVFVGCLLDALQIPLRAKTIILINTSLCFSLYAYNYTLTTSDVYIIYVDVWKNYSFEMFGLISSSLRILAIFLWKQTFYSIFRRPESAVIKKSVKIMWL